MFHLYCLKSASNHASITISTLSYKLTHMIKTYTKDPERENNNIFKTIYLQNKNCTNTKKSLLKVL